ncbi:GNAT family N-acetyltransferase [Streptococcus anginosus]|uniref:GNAT family N-acetyltransferase n=1 Tax=Streptococcus anginosus TaxID=1328 RepID=UPI00066CA065|nr:GNAT family N-acetyltransferase [Streptococcus anginosus]
MKIRQANLSDLDAITTIEWENFGPEEALSREILEAHIQKLTTSFLVAERDGQILGYLEGPVRPERHLVDQSFTSEVEDYSHLIGHYISLTSLSIDKNAQNMGLGRSLLNAMKDIAIRDQRLGINLTCHDYLVAYYEKHGFINEGVSQSTYAGEVWYDMLWKTPK